MTYHLGLLVSKDQTTSQVVLTWLKHRQLANPLAEQTMERERERERERLSLGSTAPSPNTVARLATPKQRISPSRILLALLASRAPRQHDKVMNALVGCISETLTIRVKQYTGEWFEKEAWDQVSAVGHFDFQLVFKELLHSSMINEVVAVPLTSLAFAMLDSVKDHSESGRSHVATGGGFGFQGSSANTLDLHFSFDTVPLSKAQWEVLHKDTSACSSKFPGVQSLGLNWLGEQLAIGIFRSCPTSRTHIVREIAGRLIAYGIARSQDGGSSGSGFGGSGGGFGQSSSGGLTTKQQDKSSGYLIRVLHAIVDWDPYVLLESNNLSELFEIISALQLLPPQKASALISAVAPLFKFPQSSALTDRCALALRKASFSNVVACRQAAVASLLTLLELQLAQQFQESRVSSTVNNHLRQRVATGISVEEVLSLQKRFLKQQACVRGILYEKMYILSARYPSFGVLALRLLMSHLESLAMEDTRPNANVNAYSARVRYGFKSANPRDTNVVNLGLDFEKCVDSRSGKIMERPHHLLYTLCGMVQRSHESPVEMIYSQASQDSNNEKYGMSQGANNNTGEASETCEVLWGVVDLLSQTQDRAAFGVPDKCPETSTEKLRLELYAETIIAAMTLTFNLPNYNIGSSLYEIEKLKRFQIIRMLITRYFDVMDDLGEWQEKQQKHKQKKKPKKNVPVDAAPLQPQDAAVRPEMMATDVHLHDHEYPAMGLQVCQLQVRLVGGLLASFNRSRHFIDDDDGDDEEDIEDDEDMQMQSPRNVMLNQVFEQGSKIAEKDVERGVLVVRIMKTLLAVQERVLGTRRVLMTTLAHTYSNSNSTEEATTDTEKKSDIDLAIQQLEMLETDIGRMAPVLMAESRRVQKRINSVEVDGNGKLDPNLDIIHRCLLGSVRVEISAARYSEEASVINTCCKRFVGAVDSQGRVERFLNNIKQGANARSTSTTAIATTSTNITATVATAITQHPGSLMEKLLSELATNFQRRCRNSPFMMALLVEVVDSIRTTTSSSSLGVPTPGRAGRLTAVEANNTVQIRAHCVDRIKKIFKKTKTTVNDVVKHFTTSMILIVPDTMEKRHAMLSFLHKQLLALVADNDEVREESQQNNAGVVNESSIQQLALTLTSIFDRAFADVDRIMVFQDAPRATTGTTAIEQTYNSTRIVFEHHFELIRHIIEILAALLKQSQLDMDTEMKILTSCVRVYKVCSKIVAKEILACGRKLPPKLREMLQQLFQTLSPVIYSRLSTQLSLAGSNKADSKKRKKAKNGNFGNNSNNEEDENWDSKQGAKEVRKQYKLLPELTFAIENLDSKTIKLVNEAHMDDKRIISTWVQCSQLRDFRIKDKNSN